MMGSEEVVNRSNACPPQHGSSRHVYTWLQSSSQVYFSPVKDSSWPSKEKVKRDPDQNSITSVDDTVSLSDSNHESCSSDSSSHTYYTNVTDPTDFLDDEEREHSQSKIPYLGQVSSGFREETLEEEHFLRLNELARANNAAGSARSTTTQSSASTQHLLDSLAQSLRLDNSDQAKKVSDRQRQALSSETSRTRGQRSNNRRTSCSSKNQSPPCKLTRDTEGTDHFVTLLIIFATKLITAIWPLSACPPMMTTCFNGAGVLPLQVFIQETLKRSRASYSTLQVALYYLILLKAHLPAGDFTQEQRSSSSRGDSPERRQCRAMQCGRRMFLSALMLASKYLQDRNYSARAWSKISGLRSNEINDNEREYLSLIDYSLHVPKDSFDNWSKIVISLSKLCKNRKPSQCPTRMMESDFSHHGGGNGTSLADMVPSLHLDESDEQDTFSNDWWTDIIRKLNPEVVKNTAHTEDFLSTCVPGYRGLPSELYKPSNAGYESGPELDSSPPAMDINLCDTLRSRSTDSSRSRTPSTPQTPVQMSPMRTLAMPKQPHLKNLPTPQTTPTIADGCQTPTPSGRPSLRCSASVDALRSMRRQCVMNANLDRCPPPRPQTYGPLPVRTLNRPAETIQEFPSRSTTPSVASPASTVSDGTSYTSRSRSSSISSNSSWSACSSTVPRIRAATGIQFSSPLARVSSLSGRQCILNSVEKSSDIAVTRFTDEGYGSGEEPLRRFSRNALVNSTDADAARTLLSMLSGQSENPSQSVTPTPQNYTAPEDDVMSQSPRGHKRTLSRTESLQSYMRNFLGNGDSADVVDDDLIASYDATPKQWQKGTKSWAMPRRALPNRLDNKRMALYCSGQHGSAPELAAHQLRKCVSMTAS